MTSANVIEYTIEKDNKRVGHYRQNIMCKSRYHELLKYEPLKEHTIIPYGYDEEDDYWEDDTVNLYDFLKGVHSKIIKDGK